MRACVRETPEGCLPGNRSQLAASVLFVRFHLVDWTVAKNIDGSLELTAPVIEMVHSPGQINEAAVKD